MRELARIQTFPDDVEVLGGHGAVQKQLGNAVPSLLAEVLGREIRRQLLGDKSVRLAPKLLPPDRGIAPPEEKAQRVSAEFRDLEGVHSAHPGTGKGFRATTGFQPTKDEAEARA